MEVHSRLGPHTNKVLLNYGTVPPRNYHQIYTVARTCQGLGEGLLLLVTVFDIGLVRFLKKKKTTVYIYRRVHLVTCNKFNRVRLHALPPKIDSMEANILRMRC